MTLAGLPFRIVLTLGLTAISSYALSTPISCFSIFEDHGVLVKIKNIRSLQDKYGYARVRESAKTLIKELGSRKASRDSLYKDRHALGVYGPDGTVFIYDGNHRLQRFLWLSNNSKSRFIPVKITEDYRHLKNNPKAWVQFMNAMISKKLVYVKDMNTMTPLEILSKLPKDITELSNSPMRSALDPYFKINELRGSSFKAHTQSYLVEQMLALGFKTKSIHKNPLSEKSQQAISRFISKHPSLK